MRGCVRERECAWVCVREGVWMGACVGAWMHMRIHECMCMCYSLSMYLHARVYLAHPSTPVPNSNRGLSV